MSIREKEKELGKDGDMENQHLSWTYTCKQKSTEFGFSFLQSGCFSDSYILTSKTPWIHSYIKHFKLSQSLDLITDKFCTNTSSSVLSGNQLSLHIKAQLSFLSLKLIVRPRWLTLKLTMGIILFINKRCTMQTTRNFNVILSMQCCSIIFWFLGKNHIFSYGNYLQDKYSYVIHEQQI